MFDLIRLKFFVLLISFCKNCPFGASRAYFVATIVFLVHFCIYWVYLDLFLREKSFGSKKKEQLDLWERAISGEKTNQPNVMSSFLTLLLF